jgi:hypothetical protein
MTDRFGPRSTYADLPVADLSVDSSYQRSIEARRNQSAIERICENFRWSLFGMVTVTKGLVGYLIIDGQHRTEAARRLKLASVPCLIVPPLSKKDQALAFVAANRDRVSVTQFAIHHAAAGDAAATALAAMCAAAKIEIPRYPIPANKSKPNQTMAIGALSGLLASRGHDRGIALLSAIREAWSDDSGALRAPLISAVAKLDEASPIDPEALMFALARVGHKGFEKCCAVALADHKDGPGRRVDVAAAVLAEIIGRRAAAPSGESRQIPSKSDAPPPVAKAAPAPTSPVAKAAAIAAPREREPLARKQVEQGSAGTTSATRFDAPVQRRCQGCPTVFKTRAASEYLCPTCAVAHFKRGKSSDARARR